MDALEQRSRTFSNKPLTESVRSCRPCVVSSIGSKSGDLQRCSVLSTACQHNGLFQDHVSIQRGTHACMHALGRYEAREGTQRCGFSKAPGLPIKTTALLQDVTLACRCNWPSPSREHDK